LAVHSIKTLPSKPDLVGSPIMRHSLAMARPYPIALLMACLATGCSQSSETYAASCAVPLDHWGERRIAHHRYVQPIYIRADGSVLWNQAAISDTDLQSYMSQVSAMDQEPQIVLEVAPEAPCDRVSTVRSIVDEAPLCKGPHSLCSEGSNWKQWPEEAIS
jgi:hypothetical protein